MDSEKSVSGIRDKTSIERVALDSSIAITKFDPSPQRTHLITRPRLTASLDTYLDARLTIICAPAGYGKTTLLAEWRRRLVERGILAGWLSFDEDDDDAAHVIRCLALALGQAGLRQAGKLAASIIYDNSAAKQNLNVLINIIAEDERDVVLILDEFEHLPAAIAEEIVASCLEKAPKNLHIVIASREPPSLKIANLKMQGLVNEIEAHELQFDHAEVQSLFDGVATKAELRFLESQTSGWPVAVQLLRRIWLQRGRRKQILREIETLDSTLTDYLSEQVFSSLPEQALYLLIQTSPIDRISPGVVEFMTGSKDAWACIMETEALAPFLIPLDSSLKIYRTHPIIRAYFKMRLDNFEKARRRDVYRKAAKWYASADRLVSALSCAKAAGDVELAGLLVERAGGLTMWLRSGLPRLRAIVDVLDEAVFARFPSAQLLQAFLFVKEGRIQKAREIFEKVRRNTDNFNKDRDGGRPDILKLHGLILEATLLVNECRAATDAYLQSYETSIREISEDDDAFQANTKNVLAIFHTQRGYFEKALKESFEAIDHYNQAGLINGEFFSRLHIGVNYFARGLSEDARASYRVAQNLWRKNLNKEKSKLPLLRALSSELEYECSGDLLSVQALSETLAQFRRCEWWYEIFAAASIPLIMTVLKTRGLQAALEALEQCRELVRTRQGIGLLRLLEATEISCLSLSGDIDEADRKLHLYGVTPENLLNPEREEASWRQQEAIAVALGRVYIRAGRQKLILPFLEQLEERYTRRGQIRSVIRLGLLASIAEHIAGEGDRGYARLVCVAELAAETGYIRSIAEEGDLADALLKQHLPTLRANKNLAPATVKFLNRLEHMAKGGDEQDEPILSDREKSVIREVANGMTDKEVARKLDVAPSTVKFHLKNIFRKLGVKNRAHAVSHCRNQGLLS